MKTKIFSIAVVTAMLFSCPTIEAQIKYGVHASLNLETQAELGGLWNNAQLYQGFLAGGFVEFKTAGHLSIQPEINYQKKGSKYSSGSGESEVTTRKEFNYVTVPLLIKGNFHDNGLGDNVDLSLFTGPYAGFLTSSYSRIKTNAGTNHTDMNNVAKDADWGVIFGAGLTFNLKNGSAIITELRYGMGLSEIDKTDTDLRNKEMGITFGFRF